MSDPNPATMSIEELQADIAARRERLAGTVNRLAYEAQPKVILGRRQAAAKTKFAEITTTPDGELRTQRLAAVGGAVAVLIGLAIWRRICSD